jgi:transcriptional regulator with XRE-family HTH domain
MKVNQKSLTPESSTTALASLGASLRAHRLNKRMTHEQVSEVAGFSRQTLSRIERGDPSVAIGQVMRYAVLVDGQALFALPDQGSAEPLRQRVRRTAAERAAPAHCAA